MPQLVSMTPVVALFASDGVGWRGVVGPVVSEGTSSAAVQQDISISLLLMGGSEGLSFEYSNVTVWCGEDNMQSAEVRSRARAAFLEDGPSEFSAGNALPVGLDVSAQDGPPDFASSPVQAGSYRPDRDQEAGGDCAAAEEPGTPPDGGRGTRKLVLKSAIGGCAGMDSTQA